MEFLFWCIIGYDFFLKAVQNVVFLSKKVEKHLLII